MKKSLIALAVLAASGASFAQSSVTLYGLADIWFGSVKTDDGKGNSVTNTVLNSGGVDTSRWGVKGSEDLGGGLKVNFKLENGIQIDSGAASAGVAFNRYSWVGLSGGFGELQLGKTSTAYDMIEGASDAVFDSALAPMNHVMPSVLLYNWNPKNTIYYQTPDMGGLSGAVSYSLGEDKTATVGASSITAVNLQYSQGPLALQFGYQVEDLPTTSADQKFTRLGGSYNFGVATAKLTYGKTNNIGNLDGHDATDFQIGVDFPVSSAVTVSASYAKSDDSNPAGVFESSRKGFGLAANYVLSKRTYVYGGFESNSATQAAADDAKTTIFAVGLHHTF